MFHGNVSAAIAKGLLKLKERIDKANIPPSKLDQTLNIATWNVREFGKKRRSEAAIHYIAEVIGQFDIVSLIELRDNLQDLARVLPILGPYWRAIYSDMIPDAGGNRERIAFLYDKRAVVFNGLAAEANPPRTKKGSEYHAKIDWWRAPYMASFRAGNFDFIVIAAHIRWDAAGGEKSRARELQLLADWIDAKRKEKAVEDRDILVMGDFNIPRRDDALFKALTSKGLMIPTALRQLTFGTNLAKTEHYDQILHLPLYDDTFCNNGGVLDFYDGNHKALFPDLTKAEFTYQMSDHLPLWIQVGTDIDKHKLEQLIKG